MTDRFFRTSTRPIARLEDCVNDVCPLTGRPVAPEALTFYKGKVVGFADRAARDRFLAAIVAFETAIRPAPVPRLSHPSRNRPAPDTACPASAFPAPICPASGRTGPASLDRAA